MTYAQQKKIERLRQNAVDFYKSADKQSGQQQLATQAKWLKANNALDAYQDKVFN